MEYPTVPITVVSSPTDWPTIYAALFAAFFGSAAAFILNIAYDKTRERRMRLDEINSAVYGLLMSLSSLVNLKKQYLTKFETEFSSAQQILSNINLAGSRDHIASSMRNLHDIFQSISKRDQQLNGVFIPWQEMEFPMTPSPASFHFTVSDDADLVRLVHVAKTEMNAVSKGISDRNMFWQKNSEEALIDMTTGQPGVKGIMFHFQLLSFRGSILQHVDTALVVATEALTKLEAYRAKRFKKRWYSYWFFKIFTGREHWTTFDLPEKTASEIPNKRDYDAILNVV